MRGLLEKLDNALGTGRRNFYAVDPGVKYFAWAYVHHDGAIKACGLCGGRGRDSFRGRGGSLVIENQFFDGQKFSRDIINLAQAAGDIAGQFDDVTWAPSINFPKPKRGQQSIPEQRCRKYMTPAELALFEGRPKKELEHLWDAGYFALKYAGRIT